LCPDGRSVDEAKKDVNEAYFAKRTIEERKLSVKNAKQTILTTSLMKKFKLNAHSLLTNFVPQDENRNSESEEEVMTNTKATKKNAKFVDKKAKVVKKKSRL